MTETGMILSNPYDGERRPGFVGLPLPGVTVRTTSPDDGGILDFCLPSGTTHPALIRDRKILQLEELDLARNLARNICKLI